MKLGGVILCQKLHQEIIKLRLQRPTTPQFDQSKADQNTGGALLECPVRTAMHRKSRVPSAISVHDRILMSLLELSSSKIPSGGLLYNRILGKHI